MTGQADPILAPTARRSEGHQFVHTTLDPDQIGPSPTGIAVFSGPVQRTIRRSGSHHARGRTRATTRPARRARFAAARVVLRKVLVVTPMVATLGLVGPPTALAASVGGGSAAAHACQQSGYLSRVGAGGETFTNTGGCVSFAAHGGSFATGMIIPAGQTATLSNAHWTDGPCDALTFGYQLNLGTDVPVGHKPVGCGAPPIADQPTVVGPFPTAVLLRVFLNDTGRNNGCSITSYSDGVRALVTGTDPFDISIKDSFSCTAGANDPFAFSGPGSGNLEVLVKVS